MGSCGCGDFNARYQFPGPVGVTYAFEVFAGCSNCGTPAGIIIYRFGTDGAKTWCDGLQGLPIRTYAERGIGEPQPGDIDGEFMQHVIDPEILIEKLKARTGDAMLPDADEEEEDEVSVRDILEDEGEDIISDAIFETLGRQDAALEDKRRGIR